jgi:hypothetical protein
MGKRRIIVALSGAFGILDVRFDFAIPSFV